MRSRWYKTCVIDQQVLNASLVVQVFSEIYDEERMIFQIPLAQLGFHENHLDRDRFVFYRHHPQEHQVVMVVGGDMVEWFTEKLNWIRENIHHPWSFDLIMTNAMSGYLTWSFSKASDAMLMKLTF